MGMDTSIKRKLKLPAICAPMHSVTGPDLALAACKAGIIGAIPTHNAKGPERLALWMQQMTDELARYDEAHPDSPSAPLAINISANKPLDEMDADVALCAKHGIKVIISAMGNPKELAKRAHDIGAVIYHDVTNVMFAEKAIAAGVDGVTCIGSGGGGHSGLLNHLVLIPQVRAIYDGTIIMAGAVSCGAAIRAAEILGADMAYLGTRFIATQEADVDPAYKQMLVDEKSGDLMFIPNVSGIPANWMKASLERVGLDPKNLPMSSGLRNYDHLPEGVHPWRDIWSGGQGLDLIRDIPTVEELVMRLRQEYVAACATPDMAAQASVGL